MPNNIFKLSNLNSNEDWRKNDTASKEKEISRDVAKVFEDVQKTYEEIFILITTHFWNGKKEDGLDKTQNDFCQQSLEMDQTIGIAEATSSAIEKEKFVPRETVHSIAREESRKQYNRDFTHMKNYLEKKLQ